MIKQRFLYQKKNNLELFVDKVIVPYEFDDDKSGVQADSNVFQLDLIKKFEAYENLYTKLRMVRVLGDENTVALDGKEKLNPSYTDVRFEVNYLF